MIRTILTALVLPPLFQMILVLLALLLWRVRKGLSVLLLLVSFVSLLFFSVPSMSGLMYVWLERYPAVDMVTWEGYKNRPNTAVVVLGGGKYPAPEYGGETILPRALERVRYGSRIAKLTGLPVLASGGSVRDRGVAEAELIEEAFADFGIDAIMLERLSKNTWENAKYSSDLLARQGIEEVILVTTASHMRRSVYSFEQFGMKVHPAPTHFRYSPSVGFDRYVPNSYTLLASAMAIHEILGLLVYTLFYSSDGVASPQEKSQQTEQTTEP